MKATTDSQQRLGTLGFYQIGQMETLASKAVVDSYWKLHGKGQRQEISLDSAGAMHNDSGTTGRKKRRLSIAWYKVCGHCWGRSKSKQRMQQLNANRSSVRWPQRTPAPQPGPHGTRRHPIRTQSWPLWGGFQGADCCPHRAHTGPQWTVLRQFRQFSVSRWARWTFCWTFRVGSASVWAILWFLIQNTEDRGRIHLWISKHPIKNRQMTIFRMKWFPWEVVSGKRTVADYLIYRLRLKNSNSHMTR